MVNNVEAVRIVPLDASKIEVQKEKWGVLINHVGYYGHIELRTMLGNVVDSYSGEYADVNQITNKTLIIPDHDLVAVVTTFEETDFIYVQFKHTETQVPLLIKYQKLGHGGIELVEGEPSRWDLTGEITSYQRVTLHHTHYMENVVVPRLRGTYIEISRMSNAVFIKLDRSLHLNFKFKNDEVEVSYRNHLGDGKLDMAVGVMAIRGILMHGENSGLLQLDLQDKDLLRGSETLWLDEDLFRENVSASNPVFGTIIHGVKSITNLK